MKRLAVVLTAMMIIGTSQASTNPNGNLSTGNPIITELPAKTATKNESVRVNRPRIAKPKIFRSNPYRATYYAVNPDKVEDIDIDDDAKITGYRKRDLQKLRVEPTQDDPEGIITEDIKWRLFLARTAAIIRYHQIHG